jgi:hypothetical protein
LRIVEQIGHEAPEHRDDEQVEYAEPDEEHARDVATRHAGARRAQKTARLSAKNRYTAGSILARGRRAQSHPNTGTSASIATNVAVNSHCNWAVPACTAISSRSGRRM